MKDRPEILFIAHRIPYPPDKGDKIRSWRLLDHLARRFRVHLAAFVDDPADLAHETLLREACETVSLVPLDRVAARLKAGLALLRGRPFTFGYYRDARMARRVETLRQRDLAAEIAFSSAMAPYIATPVACRARLVDLCDADSEKWRAYAENESAGAMRSIYAREAAHLAAAETDILNWADASFAASAAEAAALNARPGVERQAVVLGNGVDAAHFAPEEPLSPFGRAADVVFTGAMDYAANVDGVLWFSREVWPLVRAKAPAARFAIVGPRPAREVAALDGQDGISVEGRVEDVRPYLRHACAVVAPLRIARGVQNKVLEAMAAARPAVATSAANAGVGAEPEKEILIADDAPSFAEAVGRLLSDSAAGDAIGAAARARAIADLQWPRQLARLDQALAKCGVLQAVLPP